MKKSDFKPYQGNFDKTHIDWQKVNQLLPVIVQDSNTKQVLMLGFMNQEALDMTIDTGKVTFFSRTKGRLWTKGETSQNFLNVVAMYLDCDNDSLLVLVNPIGNTCHTGQTSCFGYQTQMSFLANLEALIGSRKHANPNVSYTASLFAQGTKRIAQKVGEEGVEVALAATAKDIDELKNEVADLWYHLTVLLCDANISWADIESVLNTRHTKVG